MADSLKRALSNESLSRRFTLWTAALQSSAQPTGRVIDAAIVVFLISSVVSITGAQAAVLIALAAWCYELAYARDGRPLYLPLLMPIAAFYLASILASITAVEPWQSFKDLRNAFIPAFFFLLVNRVDGTTRATALTYVLITAATLMAVYGLLQSLLEGPSFRVHGTMSIYMTFAGILMLIALMVLAQIVFMRPGPLLYGLIGSLILLTAALVMTHTRGAWIGFLAGITLILGSRQKRFLLALPVVAMVIFLASPAAVRERISSIVDPQDVTARERLYMWGSGLQILRDHPWTGVGMEGVKRIYTTYKHPDAVRDQRAHLHNNPIHLAAERGLIGLLCWLWIWLAFYQKTWKIFHALGPQDQRGNALVIGSLASVTGFHVAGLFEYTFGDSEVSMLVYFLMALPFVVSERHGEARRYGA